MTKLLKEMKSLLKIKLGEQGCRLSHHTKISKLLTDISKKKKRNGKGDFIALNDEIKYLNFN